LAFVVDGYNGSALWSNAEFMRISFESFAMWINPIRDFVRRIKLSDEVLVYKAADEEEVEEG